ncbi:Transcriptional regulator GntR family [Cupriavidus taiwanensis]|uniref:FadR/GntR family transcriptional regulator n=1 Tax=Cupriavidus taiwanensis TaxID=164546 RepID=UPI000E15F4BC|nr:FCD domain-containing protein [Cupriavidus taiwanensis]SOZ14429.1 Transcriptional regulator GntR family [Cupriavidus taiwanensis]SOZ25824.1 Transcriptional regulator GntR family [Cupriavidus taiwanensis]SOZ45038.1 Transcriptional regulator GntR family [Cupriavidus taiwanensis]SOZ99116.1 Transcriptional regulator GntR family [Cupriavidus taiwanensis]
MDSKPTPQIEGSKRVKRSDQVVSDIKRWIVQTHQKVGNKLPQEAALVEQMGVARGTVREALASLQAQGLVKVSTGPNGGAMLTQPPYERCLEAVSNFLYFQSVDIVTLYALRRAVEPELAANAALRLTDADIDDLEGLVGLSHPQHGGSADWNERREADLLFHDRLADACNSPMLALFCRLLNDIIRRVIVVRNAQDDFGDFDEEIFHSHGALIEAFRSRDPERARALMQEHMAHAEALALEAESRVDRGSLLMSPGD